MQHVMLDIETLGTNADTVVLSYGMVLFDPCSGQIESTATANLPLQTQIDHGRSISAQTLAWWMTQRKETFSEQLASGDDDIMVHLKAFVAFIGMHPVWGYGAGFDNTIMRSLLATYKVDAFEWPYKRDRCFRTLAALYDPMYRLKPRRATHSALHDALDQAEWMTAICAEHDLTEVL